MFDDLRAAMRLFPTGVALLTTGRGADAVGMTLNSLMSVSLDPPLVLVSLQRTARTRAVLARTGEFTLSLLAADQRDVALLFASRDKPGGADLPTGALCALRCQVDAVHPAGDHELYLGRVTEVDLRDAHREPLLFHRGALFGARLGEHRALVAPEVPGA